MPTELSGAGGAGPAKGLAMAAPEPSTYDSMYFSTAGMPTRWQKSPSASSAVARWVFHMAKMGSTVSSRSSYFILKSEVGWPVRSDWSG